MNKQCNQWSKTALVASSLLWTAWAGAGPLTPADKPLQIRTTAVGFIFNADSGTLDLSLEDTADFAFDVTYFVSQHIAVDLLATYIDTQVQSGALGAPAQDDNIGSVDLLPPILTFQYHFLPEETFQPYVGIGFNYNHFSNESGQLRAVGAHVDDTFGYVGEVGADVDLGHGVFANFNYKYLKAKPDIEANGTDQELDTLTIQAHLIGAGLGYRF